MEVFIYLSTFIFGTAVGSFLNVLVLRTGTGLGLGGRSMCLSCGHELGWRDLVPIASYIFLKGKCEFCDAKISPQYLLVELFSGLLFFASVYKFGLSINTAVLILVLLILLIILVYDFKHTIIPDWAVYSFVILSFAHTFSLDYVFSYDFWAGPILFAFFATLWVVSDGRWMGFGDAKLALGIGFYLGWELGLSAFLMSFWLGAIVGILLLFVGHKSLKMSSEIPFAPFLVFALYWHVFLPFSLLELFF